MGIATLPMQAPEKAADELKRAMTKLGLRGTMFASNIMGKNLDDPSFEPVWATAEELGAFIFIHPNNVAGADRMKSYYLNNLIGNPLDTTIGAACLYFGGVLDRYPKLTVVLAHGGGFTPYQAAGTQEEYRQTAGRHRQTLLLRHHPALSAGAGIHDRACRRGSCHAGQRLSV
jgi:aminocarboxymuconate-semialdehyde decarboxylase